MQHSEAKQRAKKLRKNVFVFLSDLVYPVFGFKQW